MSAPRIFYWAYDLQRPTGGEKRSYHHVAILRRHGYDARVLHRSRDFRLGWFDNDVPVVGDADLAGLLRPDTDVVAVPEDLGTRIQDIPGRKVIVNKNLFYGFSCLGADVPARYPYAFDDVLGAMTISEHNRRHLAWAFPRLPVQWVATGIDPATFSYRPLREKKAQILCVPKARTHLTVVYHMLQARAAAGLNRARDFTWLVSGDLSEREMARALSESALCLFLSAEEGLGRTPLEAMLAGCLVAGYQYGPVRELPAFIYAAEYAEPLALVHWIETLMAGWPLRVDCWQELVDLRRAEVLRRHRVDDEEDTVVAAWRVLLHARD